MATVCGDPVALSFMVKVPDRDPVAVGVKVTVRTQEAFGAREGVLEHEGGPPPPPVSAA